MLFSTTSRNRRSLLPKRAYRILSLIPAELASIDTLVPCSPVLEK